MQTKPDLLSKHLVLLLISLFTLTTIVGCGNNAIPGDEIEVELIEAKTELPSKVRLFFKVNLGEEYPFVTLEPADFEIYEDGSRISSLEAQAQIQRERGDFIYSSVLLLDLSGSILNNADLPRLKEAATMFINQTMPVEGDNLFGTREMAVYWFDGEQDIHPLVFFTTNRDSLANGIQSIREDISSDVSTNLNGAVVQGLNIISSRLNDIRADEEISTAGSMVVFTDGTDQAGRVSTNEALESVSNADSDQSVFTIGLGGEIDKDILSSIGKDGFELAEDSLQLNESFLAIAKRLESESNAYYVLEYCSPKRSGEHILELRAVYDDNFGSFETEFSANEFTGGCSVD